MASGRWWRPTRRIPTTQQALLDRGYALAGSSYDPNGSWWALNSALTDQFQTLADVKALLPQAPRHVLAVGTSMGGLISSLESERGNGRIDGSLTTCGIVAGGINLNNYQLDGEYTMSRLLAPDESIKLVHFTDPGDGLNTGYQLDAVASQAQATPQGRARLALAMALHERGHLGNGRVDARATRLRGAGAAAVRRAVQAGGAADLDHDGLRRIRPAVHRASSWRQRVVDGRGRLRPAAGAVAVPPEVASLYRAAGLSLRPRSRHAHPQRRHQGRSGRAAVTGSLVGADGPAAGSGARHAHDLRPARAGAAGELLPAHGRSGRVAAACFARRSSSANCTATSRRLSWWRACSRSSTGSRADVGVRWPTRAASRPPLPGLGLGDAAFIRYEPAPLSGANGEFGRGFGWPWSW